MKQKTAPQRQAKALVIETLKAARELRYMPVGELIPASRNPKAHNEEALEKSIGRWGFTAPLLFDERTGKLVAGHGRMRALQKLQEAGGSPPEGIQVRGKLWLAPVMRGWASKNDTEAEAYLLADNQLTISGGWDEGQLAKMLEDIAANSTLEGMGFSDLELAKMLEDSGADVVYTAKIEPPIYKPTGEKPKVPELYNTDKLHELLKDIDAATEVSQEERVFLRMAAQRHVVFDYQNIAEFYAHASAPLQRLMERSALVIIDYNQAIEQGFVKLTGEMARAAGESRDMEVADEEDAA